MGLEAPELARWTRFAAKGGIGKCTATCDCVAENPDDLMFLKHDEITVLLQLPDQENIFLGYCEGVVGHFSGSDVHFHAKLKVPIKAKRASTASRKSPTPDINPPVGQPSSRRSSTSKTESESLERQASQQRRFQVQVPSRIQPIEDEQQRYPSAMTFSSSSTGTDSVVTTPALGYFSSPEIKKASMYGTPSPREAQFSIEAPRSKSMPPTRASSPPTFSVSHSQATMIPSVHRQNIHMPPPLVLTHESTTPLRINKRIPTSPPVPQFSPNSNQSVSSPPLSSSVPDTSYSTNGEWSKRQSTRMSQVEVGIGLSLLQDMANGMDSDSDDGNDQWSKPDHRNPPSDIPDPDSYAASLNRVGHRRDSLDEGTQESTVEGLGYAQLQEEKGESEPAGTGKHAVVLEDIPSQTTSMMTTSPNLYSHSHAVASHNPKISPPSSTPPISPSFSQFSFANNERRPSLVPSSSSNSEWEGASDIYDDYRYSRYSMSSKMSRLSSYAGVGGWTPPLPDSNSMGRARTDSNKSRPDSSSVGARSRTDSVNTGLSVSSSSASSEIRAVAGGSLLSSLPLLPEASEIGGGQEEPQESRQQDQLHKRTTIMKDRTMSMESAASVYTQNSRFSALSQDASALASFGSNANNQFHISSTSSKANGNIPNAIDTRPVLQSVSPTQSEARSPLLHTTWDTSLSSPKPSIDGPSTRSSTASGSSDFHARINKAMGGGARAEEGSMKGSFDIPSGSFGNGVGIASALRQRLETVRGSPGPEQNQNQQLVRNPSNRQSFIQRDGLGHRIVVEDEDELPSRILDTSGSTFMSMTTTASPEPIHDEDEEDDFNVQDHIGRANASTGAGDGGPFLTSSSPEPVLKTLLAPFTVMTRTPPPLGLEGASDIVQGSRVVVEVEEKEEEQMGKESSTFIIPNVPTTPPPGQSSSSSSPSYVLAPPRLSSASGTTIRMGSPDLRPPLALSDIREPGGPLLPGSNQRQSLFLPHPNAPKSLGDGTGSVTATGLAGPGPGVPMYIAAQQQQNQQGGWARGPGGPPHMMIPSPRPNVIGVIRMALTAPPRVAMVKSQGPPGQGSQGPAGQKPPLIMPMRGPTIYGRTEIDLSGSMGPVPIAFSIDPPHVTAPHPPPLNPITTSLTPSPQGTPTPKPTMPSSPPRAPVQMMVKQQPQSELQRPPRSVSLGLTGTAGEPAVGASVTNAGPSAIDGDVTPGSKAAGGVIPRANFFPKLPGLRPRSRSFSGFNSTNAEVPQRSREEPGIRSPRDVKRSLTSSINSPLSPSSPSLSLFPSPPSGSSGLASRLPPLQPSPLSLPQNSVTGGILRQQPSLKSPTSPLSQSVVVPPVVSSQPASPNHGMFNRSQHQLRETASRSTLDENLSSTRPIPIPRSTIPGPATGSVDSPLPSSPPSQSHGRVTSIQAQSRNEASSRASDGDAASIHSDTRSHLVFPSIARQTSLRTKLSLPNLRRNRSRQEDDSGGRESEMLQVKDMEFELVKPTFAHFQSTRASDDSGALGKDFGSIDVRQDGNPFLRAESPAISMSSSASKGPPSMNEPPLSTPASRATTDSDFSMDAHRNRETKWMSLMSSSPASQARKSKKVRKLIMDGVPSSVRYLVWSYLTDGKARCVSGVYTQLCNRGRVPSSADIERDIKNCFQDQPHLQGTQGPVLSLLQAYLNMVPDIQYTMGLTLIVGQLLLLSPEEDAFWIFISIMDTHIRPYFSTLTTQMEVDSALFSRALENNDNQVARKLLVDMGISPPTICQPWFSSLFVGTLPPEYLNRIWDLFLFEGIPFLLRVALAIVACCRHAILESTSEETVLQMFRHPQPSLLPPSPDAFLSFVCSVKLKDDDVRKQRVKMEAQVKRQTQVPRTVSTAGGISLPRT